MKTTALSPASRRIARALPIALPVLLPLVFLVIALPLLRSYGLSWDEPLHRGWALLLWQWFSEGRGVLPDLPGRGLLYGPTYFLLNTGLSSLLVRMGMPLIPSLHVLGLLTASFGVYATGRLAAMIAGPRAALLAALLLMLVPAFGWHAHVNPKDIPLLAVAVFLFWSALRFLGGRTVRRLALVGFLFGIALGLKVSALILLPILLAAFLAHALLHHVRALAHLFCLHTLRDTGVFLFAAVAGLLVAWPTLLLQPSLFPEALRFFLRGAFWSQSVLYFGETYAAADLPWHYVPFHLFTALPVPLVLLLVAGIIVSVHSLVRRENIASHVLLLTWLLLPLLALSRPGIIRYDGFRHILFVLPAIAILAGQGCAWLLDRVRHLLPRVPHISVAVALLLLHWLSLEAMRAHPYGSAYTNELVRLALPEQREEQLELDYWATSYREGAAWLNEHATHGAVVCVPLTPELLQSYGLRPDLTVRCGERMDYVVLLTRFGMLPPEVRSIPGKPTFTVERFGAQLLRVYNLR